MIDQGLAGIVGSGRWGDFGNCFRGAGGAQFSVGDLKFVADIFQEVDEEVRREQLKKLWDRYGILLIAVCIAAIAAVGAWRGYEWWQGKKAAEAGAAFENAVNLAEAGKHQEADAAFAKIATDSTAGYRTLASLREAAELCCRKAHYAAERLTAVPGVTRAFADRPFFKEFVLRCTPDVEHILSRARQAGFDLGPALSQFTDEEHGVPGNGVLVAVTEKRTKHEIDALAAVLAGESVSHPSRPLAVGPREPSAAH